MTLANVALHIMPNPVLNKPAVFGFSYILWQCVPSANSVLCEKVFPSISFQFFVLMKMILLF